MRLAAAIALNEPAPMQDQQPMANIPKAGQPSNAAPKLTPVNTKMHNQLTNSGYKWTANYEPKSGQGRFGYYEHPVSGHKIVVDQMGSMQQQQEPKQAGGGGFGGQRAAGGMKFAKIGDMNACPHCGSKMKAGAAMCANCGKIMKAGGPGSGPRPGGARKTYKLIAVMRPQPEFSARKTGENFEVEESRLVPSGDGKMGLPNPAHVEGDWTSGPKYIATFQEVAKGAK